MVQPVQSPISAPSVPFEPTNVNRLYQDQFGISTMTQATTTRKALIVVGVLAVIVALIGFLRKLFSTEPTEIEAWVEQNHKSWDACHQDLLARIIAEVKIKIDSQVNPSLREASCWKITNCSCSVCKNIGIYVLQYFIAKGYKPNEIETWVDQNCDHLIEDNRFRVAHVIQLASIEMQSMINPDVREVVYAFFNTIYGRYVPLEDTKIINCVLRYFRDKNKVIQTWLLSKKKDVPEEVLRQVVQRVNEIEKSSEYSRVSAVRIRQLRFETFKKPDPIQSQALSYLTHSRVQAEIKEKCGKKKHSNDFINRMLG